MERTRGWPDQELGWLGAGLGLALLGYFFLPGLRWWYVFGHEATHAVAVWFSGGKVLSFRVTGDGGKVVADRNSPLIALAPYVFPFYPVVVLLLWVILIWIWPFLNGFQTIFWMVWGASWGFHGAYTIAVLRTAQPDFASQGFLFSWVVIFLGNLWLILGLFCLWLRPVSLAEGSAVLWEMTREDYQTVAQIVRLGGEWIGTKIGGP